MTDEKGKDEFSMNWKRGRIFHKSSVNYFLSKIKGAKTN